MKETFPSIVGQDRLKNRLNSYLKVYDACRIIPHLMFIGPRGCGKTTLAKAVGRNLKEAESDKAKKLLIFNCSTIRNVTQFIDGIVIPHIHNKECTVLLDECGELPKDVVLALRTILNRNKENRNSFTYEDYTVDFDFSRQSFMFAATQPENAFHTLMDRCKRVDLQEYTNIQLEEIICRVLPDYKFEGNVLEDVALVLRSNPRQAQKMANHIKRYLMHEKRTTFTKKDWKELGDSLGILPLGLSPVELQILYILTQKKEYSLTNLAAKTGLTPQCIRQDFEMYLQKQNLMDITTAGRSITRKGREYLAV